METHVWKFFKAGGFEQVRIDTASDLRSLKSLDQKLWVALACPIEGLEIEASTLRLIDSDKDGRIRAGELLKAVDWMDGILGDLGLLTSRRDGLSPADLKSNNDEAKKIAATLRGLCATVGLTGDLMKVDEVDKASALFSKQSFNGDGVIVQASADTDALKILIQEILETVGGTDDRSGELGVSEENVQKFFDEAAAHLEWVAEGAARAAEIQPLGEHTGAGLAALDAVKSKVDDWFARSGLAAFDGRSREVLSGSVDAFAAMSDSLLSSGDDVIAALPLAPLEPSQALEIGASINPAWQARMSELATRVLQPLGVTGPLTPASWRQVCAAFEPWRAYQAGMKGGSVSVLGTDRLKVLVASDARTELLALVARDKALAEQADAVDSAVKAVRLTRDLHALIDNFVSFRDFYGRRHKAAFQSGTLYLDGRTCELCIHVTDPNAHATMAMTSFSYLAYCELTRPATEQRRMIVAAVTNGDSDFLTVGRNGIFYDRDGKDWDARVVKVVENPISIRQAFWSPYTKFAQLVSQQIERFAVSRQSSLEAGAAAGVTAGADQVAAAPASAAAAPAAFDVAKFAGIFAAIGLALGFVASAVAALVSGFLSLRVWQMPLAIAGIILLISTPSMLLAWLKLRQRNLAPVLDASGWAINARARLNVSFGAALTQLGKLPKGSDISAGDPFPDAKPPYWLYATLVVLVCVGALLWDMGVISTWLDMAAQSLEQPPGEGSGAEPAAGSAAG
jgi:hypothetical protein